MLNKNKVFKTISGGNKKGKVREHQTFLIVCLLIAALVIVSIVSLFMNKCAMSKVMVKPFYEKAIQSLKQSPSLIYHKSTGRCIGNDNENYPDYYQDDNLVRLVDCSSDTATKHWSLLKRWLVAGKSKKGVITDSYECLDVESASQNLQLSPCESYARNQSFFLQVNAGQIDLSMKRAYFTIVSGNGSPKWCVGLGSDSQSTLLQKCTGEDSQLFYLDDDLSEEFAELYKVQSGW